jgi:hypothetical protein
MMQLVWFAGPAISNDSCTHLNTEATDKQLLKLACLKRLMLPSQTEGSKIE